MHLALTKPRQRCHPCGSEPRAQASKARGTWGALASPRQGGRPLGVSGARVWPGVRRVCSFVSWVLDCFYRSAVVSDAAVNVDVQIPIQVLAFFSTGCGSRCVIAGSYGGSVFNVSRNLTAFLLGLRFQRYMSLLRECSSLLPSRKWHPTPTSALTHTLISPPLFS